MPARILLVDDEEDVLDAWQENLKPLKHVIVRARNEAEAVAAANEHPFDLVIVDYLMPLKTGVEVVAVIRKKLPLIRSILISGRFDEKLSSAELRDTIRGRVEVDEYLHKPVKPKILRETVTRLLEGSPSIDWKAFAERSQKARSITNQDTDAANKDLARHLKPKKN